MALQFPPWPRQRVRLVWATLAAQAMAVALPMPLQLAHIALAYQGDPEAFAPRSRWGEGETDEPEWRVSLQLAGCLALARGPPAASSARLRRCLGPAWWGLLQLEWLGLSASPAPVFGLAFAAARALAQVSAGRPRTCREDAGLRLLHAEARDTSHWGSVRAQRAHGRAGREGRLAELKAWVEERDLEANLSRCEVYRACSMLLFSHFELRTKLRLDRGTLWLAPRLLRWWTQRGAGAAELHDLMLDTPILAFLRRMEVMKLMLPSDIWSEGFFRQVLALPPEPAAGSLDRPIVLEAGANNGIDTVLMCQAWPSAYFYAMEPLPYEFQDLNERVGSVPACAGRVHTRQAALSDSQGETRMAEVSRQSGASSLFDRTATCLSSGDTPGAWTSWTVPKLTLDVAVKEAGLERVDFLRLDMEGAELPVLRASPWVAGRVRLLQAEVKRDGSFVGSNETSAASLLRLLRPWGFRLLCDTGGIGCCGGHGDALFVRVA